MSKKTSALVLNARPSGRGAPRLRANLPRHEHKDRSRCRYNYGNGYWCGIGAAVPPRTPRSSTSSITAATIRRNSASHQGCQSRRGSGNWALIDCGAVITDDREFLKSLQDRSRSLVRATTSTTPVNSSRPGQGSRPSSWLHPVSTFHHRPAIATTGATS